MSIARYLTKLGALLNSNGQVQTAAVADASITYPKLQNVTAGKVLGRDTSSTGGVQELPIAVDSSGNVVIGATTPIYGEKFTVYTNSAQNAVGGELGPASNNCTAILATSQAGAVGDLFGGWHSGVNQFRVNTAGLMMFNSGFGQSAAAYGCRAWVSWDGSGTIGVNAPVSGSGNVSSVNKPAGSIYTVNFASAMPDANYAMSGGGDRTNAVRSTCIQYNTVSARSTTSCSIFTADATSPTNPQLASAMFFR